MDDDHSMSERILRTIEHIFNNDIELKEFSVVPTEDNTKNKSPVLYEEHNIGLESWCIKYIYRYAYMELMEVRPLLHKKKLPFNKIHNLNHLLIGVLVINPDVSTFWNMKRELVEQEILSVEQELLFSKIVLSYKSKSNEAFNHRRWLLKRILTKLSENDTLIPLNLLQNELVLCGMAANKTANNYHAWCHRIWSMEHLMPTTADVGQTILNELEFTYQWLSIHVSEHTGYHYRHYLFDSVKKNKFIKNIFKTYYNQAAGYLGFVKEDDPRNFLAFLLGKPKVCIKSLEENNNFVNYFSLLLFDLFHTVEFLNTMYPNHESIWYHRRYLLYNLIKTSYEYHSLKLNLNIKIDDSQLKDGNITDCDAGIFRYCSGEKQPKLFKSQPNRVEDSFLYRTLMKNETEFIKKNSNSVMGCFDNAKKHESWLKSVLLLEHM